MKYVRLKKKAGARIFDQITVKIEDCRDVTGMRSITVIKDFMAVIDRVIKKYESMSESDKKKEVLCKIAKYVNYIIEQSPEKIDFIAKDLLLDIKDPTTIELYKNLEKKIKVTTEVTGGKKTKRKKSRKVKRNTRHKKA